MVLGLIHLAPGSESPDKGMGAIVSDSPEVRLRPVSNEQPEGHPKLVALLVGEDYSRGWNNPDWGELKPLPGTWQDLARVKKTLESLGFGEIIILGSNMKQGDQKEIRIRNAGASDNVLLTFQGPASRSAMKDAVVKIKEHLHDNRTQVDSRGDYVPPLFLFYYTGHGSVDDRGIHRIHVRDDVTGMTTGNFLKNDIMAIVGADDPQRGDAGGGASLVLLDCCRSARAFDVGGKPGPDQGGSFA